jgi:hypothetical protein
VGERARRGGWPECVVEELGWYDGDDITPLDPDSSKGRSRGVYAAIKMCHALRRGSLRDCRFTATHQVRAATQHAADVQLSAHGLGCIVGGSESFVTSPMFLDPDPNALA